MLRLLRLQQRRAGLCGLSTAWGSITTAIIRAAAALLPLLLLLAAAATARVRRRQQQRLRQVRQQQRMRPVGAGTQQLLLPQRRLAPLPPLLLLLLLHIKVRQGRHTIPLLAARTAAALWALTDFMPPQHPTVLTGSLGTPEEMQQQQRLRQGVGGAEGVGPQAGVVEAEVGGGQQEAAVSLLLLAQ
jgi:hypothetical protein